MILDLVDKLIDRCIQLAKHRQEADEKHYERFVVPAFSVLEELHSDYLKSFRSYRDNFSSLTGENPDHPGFNGLRNREKKAVLSSTDSELFPLLDEIRSDSVFKAHLRTKVAELARLVEAGGNDFAKSILRCVDNGGDGLIVQLCGSKVSAVPSNAFRIRLEDEILCTWMMSPVGKARVSAAIEQLDELTASLQYNYAQVVKSKGRLQINTDSRL